MIKAIIFDCGGVVTKEITKDVVNSIAKGFNLNHIFLENRWKKIEQSITTGKITTKEFWNKYAKLLDVNKERLRNVWHETVKINSRKNSGVIKLVNEIKVLGYTVALLSDTIEPMAQVHRINRDYSIFPNVFLSCELGLKKPDKKIYKFVLNKLKVKPNECVFIDDKERNLEPAKKMGMKTILFKSSDQLKRDLQKLGVL